MKRFEGPGSGPGISLRPLSMNTAGSPAFCVACLNLINSANKAMSSAWICKGATTTGVAGWLTGIISGSLSENNSLARRRCSIVS